MSNEMAVSTNAWNEMFLDNQAHTSIRLEIFWRCIIRAQHTLSLHTPVTLHTALQGSTVLLGTDSAADDELHDKQTVIANLATM